jgi:hypothetical protein
MLRYGTFLQQRHHYRSGPVDFYPNAQFCDPPLRPYVLTGRTQPRRKRSAAVFPINSLGWYGSLKQAVPRENAMAIARCEKHPFERPTVESYNTYARPVGYPTTAAVCGRLGCENAPRIWLSPAEVRQHRRGARVFSVNSHAIRVRVGNTLRKAKTHSHYLPH